MLHILKYLIVAAKYLLCIGYHLRIPYLEIPWRFSVYSSLTKVVRCIDDVNGLKLAENARCWLSNVITCSFLDNDLFSLPVA